MEPGTALGQVCDYIHLNTVRAVVVPVSQLHEFRYSSYWYLRQPKLRPTFLQVQTALVEAGGLADTRAGWRSYADYLAWQAEAGPVGKSQAYVCMSRGWALGTKGFKTALVKDHKMLADSPALSAEGARELRRARWAEVLEQGLKAAGKSVNDARSDRKSAEWKLTVAAWMKQRTQADNRWLSAELNLGAPAAFSRNLTTFRRNLSSKNRLWQRLISISAT